MKTTIKHNDREFLVSTMDTFDAGWETLVFEVFDGRVNYRDLASNRYSSAQEAAAGHAAMVRDFQPGPQGEADEGY